MTAISLTNGYTLALESVRHEGTDVSAEVVLVNGVERHRERVTLTDIASISMFAMGAAGNGGPPMEEITSGLLRLSQNSHNSPNGDSANLANSAKPPAWEPPMPFNAHVLPAFPVAAFPERIADYIEAVALALQVPHDLVAMLVIGVLSAASAKRVEVQVREGWIEPTNTYPMTVLGPGNRKSAAYREVTAPLVAYERAEVERLRTVIAEAQTRAKIKEAELQRAEQEAARATPEDRAAAESRALALAREVAEAQTPTVPRLVVDDASPERVASILHEQGGRLAVMSPEGDVFEIIAGRYSSGTPNLGVFLKGHAGDDLRVDRVGRPAEFVQKPALTMALTIQPDVLSGLADKPSFRGRGLLGRFLYSMPQSTIGHRDTNPPPVPEALSESYNRTIMAILNMPTARDEEGRQVPHILRLDHAAREQIQAFSVWVEGQLGEFGELGMMVDWGGKLVGAMARIAGLLHVAEHAHTEPWGLPIDAGTVESAILIGYYLIPHARTAYAEMGSDPVVEDGRYLLRWIERSGVESFTKRDLFEATKGRFKRAEQLDPGLGLLIAHGFIRERVIDARPGPGRKPSPTYDVNPLRGSHNSRNSQNRQEG